MKKSTLTFCILIMFLMVGVGIDIHSDFVYADNRATVTDAECCECEAAEPEENPSTALSEAVDEPAVPASPAVTKLNGVDYSKVYDYTYYLEHNPDVERAYKGDPEKTLTHFVNYGMKERRVSIESFDVNSYCKSYKDLRSAFINDSSRYYMHYLQYGYNEGRKPV